MVFESSIVSPRKYFVSCCTVLYISLCAAPVRFVNMPATENPIETMSLSIAPGDLIRICNWLRSVQCFSSKMAQQRNIRETMEKDHCS